MSEAVLGDPQLQSWEAHVDASPELEKRAAPGRVLILTSTADHPHSAEGPPSQPWQAAPTPLHSVPRPAHGEGACTAAVRAYVNEMAESGTYPALNGYQLRARDRGWPGPRTVVARLGGWSQALRAAGFDAPRRPGGQVVSPADCIAAVAAYAAEAAARGEHPGLVGYERDAARRRWPSRTTVTARLGPWTAALAAAGVSPRADRLPTRQDCLLALGAYVAEMTAADLYPGAKTYRAMATRRGWPTHWTVVAHLGSWSKALGEAGFMRPRGPGRPYVSREDCIGAIKAYIAEATLAGRHPGVVGYDAVYQNRGWPQRQSSIIPRLGSWPGALAASGYCGPLHEHPPRVSRDRCLLAVAAYCAEMIGTGHSPSLAGYGKLARSRRWPSVATVLARLGSWQEPVVAASVDI